MRIGELSRLTGVSVRSLRHYERVGLLRAGRECNGYRSFESRDVERVRRIQSFLACGLSTEDILNLYPCLEEPGEVILQCDEVLGRYRRKLAEIEARIRSLEKVRGLLLEHIRAAERARAEPGSPPAAATHGSTVPPRAASPPVNVPARPPE